MSMCVLSFLQYKQQQQCKNVGKTKAKTTIFNNKEKSCQGKLNFISAISKAIQGYTHSYYEFYTFTDTHVLLHTHTHACIQIHTL